MSLEKSTAATDKPLNRVRMRLYVAFVVVVALFGVLVYRLWYLQVVQHDVHATLSEDNRLQVFPLPPPRGRIYDRNGELLADNEVFMRLVYTDSSRRNLEEVLDEAARYVTLTEDDRKHFYRRLKRRHHPTEPVIIKKNPTEAEVNRLAVDTHRLERIAIQPELVRYYPHGNMLGHVLGYVGRINEQELESLDKKKYQGTRYIGKTGIERFYESALHGDVGYEKVEANVRGKILRTVERNPPRNGVDMYLNLDMRLQRAADEALGERRGAVVAIDTRDGGILAMVSHPKYDPNLFVQGIDGDTYRSLLHDPDQPLYNRAVRGRYPPGSTVKGMWALAFLEYGVVTPSWSIRDPGYFSLPGNRHRYRDWKRQGHGTVNLRKAIQVSCDTYFYNRGSALGIDKMSEFGRKFGLGGRVSYDLPEEGEGVMPSREWKRAARGVVWYPGETVIASIGQGYMVMTPLQLATMTAVIANKGRYVQPRLARPPCLRSGNAVDECAPIPWKTAFSPMAEKLEDVILGKDEYWDHIHEGMVAVVSDGGTARRIGNAPYVLAGKSGTAQVFSLDGRQYNKEDVAERLRDHALFVAFAPLPDPKIAVAVIVENGGGGSSTAAPVARQVLDAWLLDYLPTAESWNGPDDQTSVQTSL
jgi:penicillin-binding protein 2